MIAGCVVNAAPDAAPDAEVVTAMDVGAPRTLTAEEAVLSALVYEPDDVSVATLNV